MWVCVLCESFCLSFSLILISLSLFCSLVLNVFFASYVLYARQWATHSCSLVIVLLVCLIVWSCIARLYSVLLVYVSSIGVILLLGLTFLLAFCSLRTYLASFLSCVPRSLYLGLFLLASFSMIGVFFSSVSSVFDSVALLTLLLVCTCLAAQFSA